MRSPSEVRVFRTLEEATAWLDEYEDKALARACNGRDQGAAPLQAHTAGL